MTEEREKKGEIDEKEIAIALEEKPALCAATRYRTGRTKRGGETAFVHGAREIGVSPMKNEIYKLPHFYTVILFDASVREKCRNYGRNDFLWGRKDGFLIN